MRSKPTFDDLVDAESREIAKQILEEQLAKHGLPLPKPQSLDIHIDQLLATNTKIREMAARRVEAKQDAYSESLKAIGLNNPNTNSRELDIRLDLKF